ncbi:hypothetical protein D3C81_2063160 [compost metagenome]
MQIHLCSLDCRALHQHGNAAASIQQMLLLFRLQQPIGESCLMNDLPETISRMGKVKTRMGGRLAWVDPAEHHPQPRCQNIVDHLTPR